MREIKFRGRKISDGTWVYGSYMHQYFSTQKRKLIDAIFYTEAFQTYRPEIIPESVGQFIGLNDKNDREIYEGDIIHISHPHKEREYTGAIYYDESSGAFRAKDFNFSHHDNPSDFIESIKYAEVIGNIHESNTVGNIK